MENLPSFGWAFSASTIQYRWWSSKHSDQWCGIHYQMGVVCICHSQSRQKSFKNNTVNSSRQVIQEGSKMVTMWLLKDLTMSLIIQEQSWCTGGGLLVNLRHSILTWTFHTVKGWKLVTVTFCFSLKNLVYWILCIQTHQEPNLEPSFILLHFFVSALLISFNVIHVAGVISNWMWKEPVDIINQVLCPWHLWIEYMFHKQVIFYCCFPCIIWNRMKKRCPITFPVSC